MKKIHEEIKRALESKAVLRILEIVGVVLVVLLVFAAGISVGFHKASFGRDWGEHYNENFGMGHMSLNMLQPNRMGMMDDFPNAHGAIGKIIKLELPNIIVQDKNNIEKAVLLSDDTQIQEGGAALATTDLKIDDFAVVIGTPNPQGMIEAKFIRILPSPEFVK